MGVVHLSAVLSDIGFQTLVALLDGEAEEILSPGRFEVNVGRTDVSHDVVCELGESITVREPPMWLRTVLVGSAEHRRRFPELEAEFQIRPVKGGVEVAIEGTFTIPGGLFGWMLDRVALHQAVEESIERYFDQVLGRMRNRLQTADAMIGVPI